MKQRGTDSLGALQVREAFRARMEFRDLMRGNSPFALPANDKTTEYRHVLMDYEQNKQLKARMLTRLEAWKRNEVLRGTGFAWAMCSL